MIVEFKNGSKIETIDTQSKNIGIHKHVQIIGCDIAKEGSVDQSAMVSKCLSCNAVIELLTGNYEDLEPTHFHKCPACGVRFNTWIYP